jgi:hypothetical protein
MNPTFGLTQRRTLEALFGDDIAAIEQLIVDARDGWTLHFDAARQLAVLFAIVDGRPLSWVGFAASTQEGAERVARTLQAAIDGAAGAIYQDAGRQAAALLRKH